MPTPQEIERIYSPIADAVDEFAQMHSLQLEKCARGNFGWELTRPHPDGGSVTLMLLFDATLGFGIGAVWFFACPEMSRRYLHFRPVRSCELNADSATAMLEDELQAITKVPFGYWSHVEPL